MLFMKAVELMAASFPGGLSLLEVGPHSTLELPIKQTIQRFHGVEMTYVSLMSRGKSALETVLEAAGRLWLTHAGIDIARVNKTVTSAIFSRKGVQAMLKRMPKYCWNYTNPAWYEPRASRETRYSFTRRHDLLGVRIAGLDGKTVIWRRTLNARDVPWLAGHKLGKAIVFPAGGYLAMAVEALSQQDSSNNIRSSIVLRDFAIAKALQIADSDTVEIFTKLWPATLNNADESGVWWELTISSISGTATVQHVTAAIRFGETALESSKILASGPMQKPKPQSVYACFGRAGLQFGPDFQSLSDARIPLTKGTMFAATRTQLLRGGGTGALRESDYPFHPITLDAMLQTGLLASCGGDLSETRMFVPTFLSKVEIVLDKLPSHASICDIRSRAEWAGIDALTLQAELIDAEGRLLVRIEGARCARLRGASLHVASSGARHPFLRIKWKRYAGSLRELSRSDWSSLITHNFGNHRDNAAQAKNLEMTVDDLVHSNPDISVLEVRGTQREQAWSQASLGDFQSALKRCRTHHIGHTDVQGRLVLTDEDSVEQSDFNDSTTFDLAFLSPVSTSCCRRLLPILNDIKELVGIDLSRVLLPQLRQLISSHGSLLFLWDTSPLPQLDGFRFTRHAPKSSEYSVCIGTRDVELNDVSMNGKSQKPVILVSNSRIVISSNSDKLTLIASSR